MTASMSSYGVWSRRIAQADAGHGVDAELLEESSEMFAQKWMSSNTQHAHGREYVLARAISHPLDGASL